MPMLWKDKTTVAPHLPRLAGTFREPYLLCPIVFFWITITYLFAPVACTAEPAHPSLLFSQQDLPALRNKISQGWLKDAFAFMKTRADSYLSLNTNPYTAYQSAAGGRAMHSHVATLAMTGWLTGEQKYFDKATSIIMPVADLTTTSTFFALNEHLAVSDAGHTFAIAYDWLHPYLTAPQRALLRNEVIQYGQWLYDYTVRKEYYGRYDPVPLSCNHNSVHHGALGLCALALGDRTAWLDTAKKFVGGYFIYSLDATGYSYEGLGYFGYGYYGAIPFCVALKRSGGPDLVLANSKNQLVPRHVLHQIAPWGSEVVAMNDSNERIGNPSGLMHLISAYQDRVGLHAWFWMFGPEGNKTYGADPGGYLGDGASLPYTILFADPALQPLSPGDAKVSPIMIYDSGRASWRTGWEALDALATFTSGFDQHRGHNHKDENSFTFYSRGEKFVIDPTYVPWETRSHNTIIVDGQGQWRDSNEYDVYGKVIDKQDFGVAWAIKGEAAEAFPAALKVAKAQRQFLFASGRTPYAVIADDIEKTSQTPANYTWLLHTDRKNAISIGANGLEATIRGWRRNALCKVHLLHPAQGIALTETDLSTQTFIAREKTYFYKNYFKEIQAGIRAANPRFVAVIVAADTAAELPQVSASGPPQNMIIEVKWSDREKDRITLTGGRFQFNRERADTAAGIWDY